MVEIDRVDVALIIFLWCLALGALSGFMAGLLGIGGGLVIVPVLIFLLPLTAIDLNLLMPMALGTSLAAIFLTSVSATLAHKRLLNIPVTLLPPLLCGIGFGALCGSYFADSIAGATLKLMFACFVLLMALQMWRGSNTVEKKADNSDAQVNKLLLFFASIIIGGLSSVLGIGGGMMMVPLLTWSGILMTRAVAASAVCGLAVASMGSVGYLWAGLHTSYALPQWSFGYIYLPALAGIITLSLFTAPLGVKAARVMPPQLLKRGFSVLLMSVGLKMLVS